MLDNIFGILKIIGILVVFIFMLFAHRENDRTFKREMNKLKEEGKLPSKKVLFLRILIVFALMLPIPIILSIITIHVRKVEFSRSIFFSGIVVYLVIEMIIGSVISIIQSLVIDCKKMGNRRAILSFLFAIIATAIVIYIRYNW